MSAEAIVPDRPDWRAQYESAHASPGLRVGNTIYCCGVTGWDPDLRRNPPDLSSQIEQAFRNATAILEAAGASWKDVVRGVSYHVGDLPAQVQPFIAVRDRYVTEPYPVWTAAAVTGLPDPEAFVEIEITAVIGARD